MRPRLVVPKVVTDDIGSIRTESLISIPITLKLDDSLTRDLEPMHLNKPELAVR
jgi:hypothetical protein